MSDLGLVWDNTSGADLSVNLTTLDAPLFEVGLSGMGDEIGGTEWAVDLIDDYSKDDGLNTAVFLSLFTDRRAEDSDSLPDGTKDRRGWWGDAFPVVSGDLVGSRLWLLARSKPTQDVLDKAVTYAKEALQWMLDDKVSDKIDVSAVFTPKGDPGKSWLVLSITISRPQVDPVTFRYNYAWVAQESA